VRRLPFLALVLLGAGALTFDLTLSRRLPSDADWAEAAGALRARGEAGDAVQLWPVWAERARLFVDALPVLAEEDLAHADYVGVKRLWVLSLPSFGSADAALVSRGATAVSEPQRFGALALQAWDLHLPELATNLTRAAEEHEVDYVARRCQHLPIGSRFPAHGSGSALHVRAGVIGEHAYDRDKPPIDVQIFSNGTPLGTLSVPPTLKDGTGWRALDVPLPAGPAERDFVFAVSSSDASRPFCLQAWTTR
jgi:hypothetical protein